MTIRIYIASPWTDRHVASEAARKCQEAGFEVTSRWLTHDDDSQDGMDIDPKRLQDAALRDIEDVLNSHVLILLNTQPRGEETSGKAVEMGIAIATLKGIIVVGERTNVFHHLGAIPVVASIEEAIEELQHWEPQEFEYGSATMLAATRRAG